MKKMQLADGFKCSLHRHPCKDEAFFIVSGQVIMELGSDPENLETLVMHPHDHIRIAPGEWHRFSNCSGKVAYFVEASTYDDPTDVQRLEESGPLKYD